MVECIYKYSCGYDQCEMEDCPEYEGKTIKNSFLGAETGPQAERTVTLTMEQWKIVLSSLLYKKDRYHASMTWFAEVCDDKKLGRGIAAQYEQSMKQTETVHALIEAAL